MSMQMIMFGADIQLERLSKLGDPLERINAAIDLGNISCAYRKAYSQERIFKRRQTSNR